MTHFKRHAARVFALLLFAALFAAAVLYNAGVYDFTFLPRDRGGADATSEIVETKSSGGAVENPDEPDEYALQFVDALLAATNISRVGAGVMTGGEPISFDFDTLAALVPEGYELSYADFDEDGTMRLCLLTLDVDLPEYASYEVVERLFYSTKKDSFSVPVGKDSTTLAVTHGVRLYMGYILVDNGTDMYIYTADGKELLHELSGYLYPALCRDLDGHPLFLLARDDYWYFDENGTLKKSDYNDATDSRGLYFDYTPDYGVADNEFSIYYIETTVTSAVTRLVTTADPSETDAPETAVTIYTEEPLDAPDETTAPDETADVTVDESSTAEPTDSSEATAETTADGTTDDPAASTDVPSTTDDAPATAPIEPMAVRYEQLSEEEDPYADWELDPYAPYDPDNPYDDPSAHWTRPEETEPPETTAEPEITTVPAETTEIPAETTTIPDETTETPEETTTDPEETEPTETTAEPEYEVVEVLKWNEYRFAYGWSPWYILTRYKYSRSFNFREGHAVSVWYDDVLSVINEYGDEDWRFTRQGFFYNENGRLAYSIYTEPCTRGIESIGSYYFDRGYLRVRKLDTDAYYGNPDWLVGDVDLLLDENGNEFPIPEGYTLVAYSDGVLLLERAGKYGYYTTDGVWIAQPIYTYARPFSEGLGVIGFSRGIKGVIDTDGNVVLPFVYAEISQVSSGVIACYSHSAGWQFFAKAAKTAGGEME